MLIRLSPSSVGYICGVAAFGLWAVLPVYLKLFQDVPPQKVLFRVMKHKLGGIKLDDQL